MPKLVGVLHPMQRVALIAIASSLLLSPTAQAKSDSFDLPVCGKIIENERTAQLPAEQPVISESESPAPKVKKRWYLAPLKLTNDKDSFIVGTDGKIKMEVQQTVALHEGPHDAAEDPTANKSVIGNDNKLKNKLLKDARAIDIGPIALRESESEAQQKADTITDAERMQLSELWAATINKSPDIQFVINKLQPTSNQAHTTAKAIQMIGNAIFQVGSMAPLVLSSGPGMTMVTTSGVSLLQSLLNEHMGRNIKKQQITDEQMTMLYTMVRHSAEKVVIEYRQYRHSRNELERAHRDLQDLKSMVASAYHAADPSRQIEMEYTIRKAHRDVDKVIGEVKLHRQQLIDLAGGEAIARLETQMDLEVIALKRLVGAPTEEVATGGEQSSPNVLHNPLKVPAQEIAGKKKNSSTPQSLGSQI